MTYKNIFNVTKRDMSAKVYTDGTITNKHFHKPHVMLECFFKSCKPWKLR